MRQTDSEVTVNANFFNEPPQSPEDETKALQLYFRQLLECEEMEQAAEVLLQLAEISDTQVRAGMHEVTRLGQLEQIMEKLGQGDSWMRLARVSVLQGLRNLARPSTASPAAVWAEQPRAELFGALRLSYQCRTLTPERWPSAKAMRLFAYLVGRQGAPVSCAAAIEMLWPELTPGRGRSSLRNCIYQIRYALRDLLGLPGEGLLRCRVQDALSLDSRFETDVDSFERAAEQARKLQYHQPLEALHLASSADSLYRAPFLEGLEDAWIQPLRARLAAARGNLLHVLTNCQLTLGHPQLAEQTARRALQHDDLCEQAWADLLAAQIGQGRESEARRLYRDAVAHFQSELGFRPTVLGEAYDRLLAPPAFRKVS
ncbi:hypothetical protein DYH09_07825 [bacterium CPR1]|nr:hypothetical protein [bacterium CPR1]